MRASTVACDDDDDGDVTGRRPSRPGGSGGDRREGFLTARCGKREAGCSGPADDSPALTDRSWSGTRREVILRWRTTRPPQERIFEVMVNYVVRADSASRVEEWLRDTLRASSFDVSGISLDDVPKWEIWEIEEQDDAKHPWRP
jgi:hypothetical protein